MNFTLPATSVTKVTPTLDSQPLLIKLQDHQLRVTVHLFTQIAYHLLHEVFE